MFREVVVNENYSKLACSQRPVCSSSPFDKLLMKQHKWRPYVVTKTTEDQLEPNTKPFSELAKHKEIDSKICVTECNHDKNTHFEINLREIKDTLKLIGGVRVDPL